MYRVLFLHFVAFLFIAFHTSHSAMAQNLVPNGSFEEYDACPDWPGDFHTHLHHWESWRGSPDFFHACDTTLHVGTPLNLSHGYQIPKTGLGYGGIIGLLSGGQRELMGVELVNPLETGQEYYVEFYWNRAFGGWGHDLCDCAMSHLGALFTTRSFESNSDPSPITNFAHIYDSALLVDTTNWRKISGWVEADSAYTHIGIGNFFDLDSAETAYFNGSPNEILLKTYYFIEDVCVAVNPEDCNLPLHTINTIDAALKLYPNPANDALWIETASAIKSCRVYNSLGSQVLQSEKMITNRLDIRHLSSGLYIIHIETNTGTYKGKFLKTLL